MRHALTLTALLCSYGPLLAQEPAPPPDSAQRDASCLHGPDSPALLVAAVFLAAPPLLAPLAHCLSKAAAPPGFARPHVTASVTGGPALADSAGATWAHSQNVELYRAGLYAELRLEHFYLPQVIRYRTVRAGYLARPVPGVATGVTVGYRAGRGPGAREGVELGLPWIAGLWRGWIRFEPTYVVGRDGADWSYRLQTEFPIARGPLLVGFNVEAKALPLRKGGSVGSVTPALVLGARY